MLFFMVFKSPLEGQTHVFRPGEPMLQINVVPETAEYELVEMTDEEQADRELRSERIQNARDDLLKDTRWASTTHTDLRRHLQAHAARREGAGGADGVAAGFRRGPLQVLRRARTGGSPGFSAAQGRKPTKK